jgi:SEL1 protein
VQLAWHALKELDNTRRDASRSFEPRGFLGSALHYAKVAFRLMFMNGPAQDHAASSSQFSVFNAFLFGNVHLLKHAAALGDPDAMFLLAEMNFYGNFSHPRDYPLAFKYYDQLASTTGNSTAQYMLGFMYATGVGGAVERDQAKALLYHTFAAEQGNIRSEMTLGFRYHSGISTTRNCEKATHFYKRVADKAMAYWKSGPPGGRNLVKESYRWADEDGGVYGEGASVSSSGFNANRDKNNHASTDDIMEYLDMLARKGDLKATFSLAKMYYDGSRTTKRNVRKAQRLFMKIARQYWDKQGKIITGGPKGIDKIAAKAAAHIGRMFLRGEGWEQSYEKAATWFRRGIANGDPLCQYLMGLMYRDGLGVPQDSFKAASYFRVAADEDLAAAQANLGILFLDQGELETAGRYFELAARHGHLEAFYYLAELTNKGIGREQHCGVGTAYYKIVAESVEEIHSSFAEANEAYENGDLETAVVASMMAAEQGYETAQANTAYLIDEQTPVLKLPPIPRINSAVKRPAAILRNAALALIYWTRSAKQANIDSLLKMGDYYLSGFGTPAADPEKASTCYQTAAEVHHSAQALWNLGWMHENGVAVEQDFHMAKRYYDLALETNSEAYLPVKLALIKLRARSYWNTLTRGKVNSIQAEPAKAKKSRTISEWIAQFLEYADEDLEEGEGTDLELESAAFGSDAMPGGDDSYYEDVDDGLVETLIIIGIAATLAFLVYYRQQRQLQQRRVAEGGRIAQNAPGAAAPGRAAIPRPTGAAGAAQPPGAAEGDRGFFPNPGDPDYAAWAAGGIGH